MVPDSSKIFYIVSREGTVGVIPDDERKTLAEGNSFYYAYFTNEIFRRIRKESRNK